MLHGVVAKKKVHQPRIGLLFSERLVKVVERLVHLLDGAKLPLNLALRPGGDAAAVTTCQKMGAQFDLQITHNLLKNADLGDGTVVGEDHLRNSMKWKSGLFRHRIEQEAQRRLDIFSVHAAVFLIGHAAVIVHHAEQHQRRRRAIRPQPGRLLDLLQVRRAEIKLPTLITVVGLKADGGWLARPALLIEVPLIPDRRKTYKFCEGLGDQV